MPSVLAVECSWKRFDGGLVLTVTNISGADIFLVPPYFAPASNVFVYVLDKETAAMRALNPRGSSQKPAPVEMRPGEIIEYTLHVVVPKDAKIIVKWGAEWQWASQDDGFVRSEILCSPVE